MASIVAIASVFAMCIVACGLGRPVLDYLDNNRRLNPLERIVVAGLLGAMVEATIVALVGSYEYSTWSMTAVLATSGVIALALNRRTELPRSALLAGLTPAAQCMIAGALILWLLVAAGAFAPPADHDTMRYHGTLIRRDFELARIAVHYGWSAYEFMPPLSELLSRMAYALGGIGAAQFLTSVWLAAAAAGAAILALRIGAGSTAAALAALLVIGQRVSIHLGAAVTVDFALATFLAASTALLLAWRDAPTPRLAILLGLVLGGMANVKYHGFVLAAILALPMFWAAARRRIPAPQLITVAAIATLAVLPLLIRNLSVTGNPVFPMFHHIFGPENLDIFAEPGMSNRRGEGLAFLFSLPWTIFTSQLTFDGLQFGFPFVLIFLPFAFVAPRPEKWLLLGVAGLYLAVWGAAMPHLLRFFIAVLPVLGALAADGATRVAHLAWSLGRPAKIAFAGLVAVGLFVQSMFIAATTLRRLPAALGLESQVDYLEQPAFLEVTHARACQFIEENLRPGETYLSLLQEPTFYCPQRSAIVQLLPGDAEWLYKRSKSLPQVPAAQLARFLSESRLRFVVTPQRVVYDDHKLVFAKYRFDDTLLPVLRQLSPILETKSARVYDGDAVIRALLSP